MSHEGVVCFLMGLVSGVILGGMLAFGAAVDFIR